MSSDKEAIKVTRHLECPVCLGIPRDGAVYQCQNGHNICWDCLGKLEGDKVSASLKHI